MATVVDRIDPVRATKISMDLKLWPQEDFHFVAIPSAFCVGQVKCDLRVFADVDISVDAATMIPSLWESSSDESSDDGDGGVGTGHEGEAPDGKELWNKAHKDLLDHRKQTKWRGKAVKRRGRRRAIRRRGRSRAIRRRGRARAIRRRGKKTADRGDYMDNVGELGSKLDDEIGTLNVELAALESTIFGGLAGDNLVAEYQRLRSEMDDLKRAMEAAGANDGSGSSESGSGGSSASSSASSDGSEGNGDLVASAVAQLQAGVTPRSSRMLPPLDPLATSVSSPPMSQQAAHHGLAPLPYGASAVPTTTLGSSAASSLAPSPVYYYTAPDGSVFGYAPPPTTLSTTSPVPGYGSPSPQASYPYAAAGSTASGRGRLAPLASTTGSMRGSGSNGGGGRRRAGGVRNASWAAASQPLPGPGGADVGELRGSHLPHAPPYFENVTGRGTLPVDGNGSTGTGRRRGRGGGGGGGAVGGGSFLPTIDPRR